MKPRLYFDTSVFGGVYDNEFMKETTQLFKMVEQGEIICVYSDLTVTELENAPEMVKDYFQKVLHNNAEKIEITAHCKNLAAMYVTEKVVGLTSLDDCLHIAAATIDKVDILVSWNFKHIVNVFRIRGYNAINIREGYSQLDIRSPKEIISYENES
jgi:predicted nucleic acid-binding protein